MSDLVPAEPRLQLDRTVAVIQAFTKDKDARYPQSLVAFLDDVPDDKAFLLLQRKVKILGQQLGTVSLDRHGPSARFLFEKIFSPEERALLEKHFGWMVKVATTKAGHPEWSEHKAQQVDERYQRRLDEQGGDFSGPLGHPPTRRTAIWGLAGMAILPVMDKLAGYAGSKVVSRETEQKEQDAAAKEQAAARELEAKNRKWPDGSWVRGADAADLRKLLESKGQDKSPLTPTECREISELLDARVQLAAATRRREDVHSAAKLEKLPVVFPITLAGVAMSFGGITYAYVASKRNEHDATKHHQAEAVREEVLDRLGTLISDDLETANTLVNPPPGEFKGSFVRETRRVTR